MSDDIPLAEQSRLSRFFANDPDYLQASWQQYVDYARKDRDEKGKQPKRPSYESTQALQAHFDAVRYAHQSGVPTYARLAPLSRRPLAVKQPVEDQ